MKSITKLIVRIALLYPLIGLGSCHSQSLQAPQLLHSKKDFEGKVYEELYRYPKADRADSIVYVQLNGSKTKLPKDRGVKAAFVGGKKALNAYLEDNLTWPTNFDGEGSLVFNLFIDPSGKLVEQRLIKPLDSCKECTASAVAFLTTIQSWEPAKVNGQAVASSFFFSVPFKPYPTTR